MSEGVHFLVKVMLFVPVSVPLTGPIRTKVTFPSGSKASASMLMTSLTVAFKRLVVVETSGNLFAKHEKERCFIP